MTLAKPLVMDEAGRRPVRVMAIVPCPTCYGLQNLTLSFFTCLPGWVKSHFLNTRWSDGEFSRRLAAAGIPYSLTWFGMFSRRLDRENLRMTLECLRRLPGSYWDFLKLYFRMRPDIVYLANHHEIILLFPILIWMRHKVVCHMHDPPPAIPFQKLTFFFWRMAVSRFVFISRSVRERTALLGPLTSRDVVIHNGVKVSPLREPRARAHTFRDMFGWPQDCVIFGMTGQIAETKGHEDFLEAVRIAHLADPRIRAVIGGRGDPTYTDHLKALVRDRGMQGYVGFAGWLPSVEDFYEAIDVFVLASRHDEGFGLVLAEAGERGLPAVITPSGGAAEVAQPDRTALVVPFRAPAEMAGAMTHLAQDDVLRAQMGRQARAHIEAAFDLDVAVARFVAFLANRPMPAGP